MIDVSRCKCIIGEMMTSFLYRVLLAITAVAPAGGAAALTFWLRDHAIGYAIGIGAASALLVIICSLIIVFADRTLPVEQIETKEVEPADNRVLEFLLTYMLPVFSSIAIKDVTASLALFCYSTGIILLLVIQGNCLYFNPVLSIIGYRFYIIKSQDDMKYLLISKKNYHRSIRSIRYVQLSDYIFMETTK